MKVRSRCHFAGPCGSRTCLAPHQQATASASNTPHRPKAECSSSSVALVQHSTHVCCTHTHTCKHTHTHTHTHTHSLTHTRIHTPSHARALRTAYHCISACELGLQPWPVQRCARGCRAPDNLSARPSASHGMPVKRLHGAGSQVPGLVLHGSRALERRQPLQPLQRLRITAAVAAAFVCCRGPPCRLPLATTAFLP